MNNKRISKQLLKQTESSPDTQDHLSYTLGATNDLMSQLQANRNNDLLDNQCLIQDQEVAPESIKNIMQQLKCLNDVKYISQKKEDQPSKDNVSQGEDNESDDVNEPRVAPGQKIPETEEQRKKRLFQNKKSAQKCRLKKALEFESMRVQYLQIQKENEVLKEKLSQTNMLLLTKIQENKELSQKLDQNTMNSTMLLTNYLMQPKQEIPEKVFQKPEDNQQKLLMHLVQQIKNNQDMIQSEQSISTLQSNLNGLGTSVNSYPHSQVPQLSSIMDNSSGFINSNKLEKINCLKKQIESQSSMQSNSLDKLQALLIGQNQKSQLLGQRLSSQMMLPKTKMEMIKESKIQKATNQSAGELQTNTNQGQASNLAHCLQNFQQNLKNDARTRTPQILPFNKLDQK